MFCIVQSTFRIKPSGLRKCLGFNFTLLVSARRLSICSPKQGGEVGRFTIKAANEGAELNLLGPLTIDEAQHNSLELQDSSKSSYFCAVESIT